ncbi:nuclear transport factor 2 family protein [Kribbella sp. NPDC026611]|uniref:nuclear transport factor 2 family protein n=1 Tax=Kribbella sp. NPDC026611 TaxID=3154911 RepID=UPI0033D672B9
MSEIIDRLVTTTNAHDLDGLVACFAGDYVNTTPAHPSRGFTGREQVRRNWTAIFAAVPDLTARVTARAVSGAETWTEWEMMGTRRDGARHAMAGVIVFTIREQQIAAGRFYLEPVEYAGDANAAIQQQFGDAGDDRSIRGTS